MTTDHRCRVGLIGLGEVGIIHLEAYVASERVEVVAIAEVDPARRSNNLMSSDAAVYDCHRALLQNERLDMVCVLTPAATHRPIAMDCADAGVPTLCEKPLAHTLDDAKEMRDYFSKASVPLFYGSSYRHLPAIRAARDIIASGVIGSVKLIREFITGGRGPDAQRPYSVMHYPEGYPGGTGMGLMDHGIHLLDIMPWLLDSPVTAAWGRGNRTGEPLTTEFATLQFANSAVGQLIYEDGSWTTALPMEGLFSKGAGWDFAGPVPPGQWDREPATIHVHGTLGALRICHYANALFLNDATGVREIKLAGEPAPAHFRHQIEAFAADLTRGSSPSSSVDDGIRALEILENIYRSRFEEIGSGNAFR